MKLSLSEIIQKIADERSVIITPYPWPDLDGLATSIALKELLHSQANIDVAVLISETPQTDAQWAIEHFGLPAKPVRELPDCKLVVVDTSEASEIPDEVREREVLANIDHHIFRPQTPIDAQYVHRVVCGACASIIVQSFMNFSAIISEPTKVMLYCAIQTNSFLLEADETSDIDRTAIEMLEAGHKRLLTGRFRELMTKKRVEIENGLAESIGRDMPTLAYKLAEGNAAIGQLELPDAFSLLKARINEIRAIMIEEMNVRNAMIYICLLNCYSEKVTYLVGSDEPWILEVLHSNGLKPLYRDGVIRLDRPRTRKWLVAALQE